MKIIQMILALLALAVLCFANPASNETFFIKQPDGSSVEVRQVGDENFHVLETADGYILQKDALGYYAYADEKGESSGIYARDAQAAFDFLMSTPGINHSRIGYCGHSEGGQIAFINASRDPRVAFVVSLAGPAVRGRDVMVQQNLSLLDISGITCTPAQVAELNGIFDDIVNIADTAQLQQSLRQRLAASTLQHYTPELLEQSVAVMTSPWYMSFVRFNPKPYLEKINCQVLALGGEWDFQVNAEQTFTALKASVSNVRCELLPEHNHMFQKCPSKLASLNYPTLGNISATTLGLILDFVKGVYTKKQ